MARKRHSYRMLTVATLIGSAALVAGLFAAYLIFRSQLALAQAADSFLDVFTAAILTWTVAIAAQPEDEDHPFGHSRAEPIGGLVTAVIAGVLAIEVARSAGDALLNGYDVQLKLWLVYVFALKLVFKIVVFALSTRAHKTSGSPAMRALKVDARNDVLVSILAIAGFFAARQGLAELDAWLSFPVAAWIAWSGVDLARENIRYLMGEAPSQERQAELEGIARAAPGVKRAHDLRAHYLGTELQVHVHIVVAPDLSVKEAHDIGEGVRIRLESERDVVNASVHIDIE